MFSITSLHIDNYIEISMKLSDKFRVNDLG